jgi:hypothetical protein
MWMYATFLLSPLGQNSSNRPQSASSLGMDQTRKTQPVEPLAKLPGKRHYGFRCPFGAMACSEGVATFYTTHPHPYFLA